MLRPGLAPLLALNLALLLAGLPVFPALAQDAPPLEADTGPRAASPPPASGPAQARPAPAKIRPVPAAAVKPALASHAVKPAGQPAGKPASARAARGPAVQNDGKRYLRSLDENHDGRISREEFLAGAKKRFAKLDANGDGVISAKEAAAAKAKAEAKAEARRKARGEPPRARRGGSRPYLANLDTDRNGRITRKEFLARREKEFAAMDLNHDGIISKEEARAAKAKKLARREEIKVEKEGRLARKRAKAEAAVQSARPEPDLSAESVAAPAARPLSPQNP